MSVFNKIRAGLEEAIAYERGELHATEKKMSVSPVGRYNPHEIKNIRLQSGMTQAVFAEFMGVSVKTVEGWEAGRNRPVGSARRLLELTKEDPKFPQKAGIVSFGHFAGK